MFSSIVTVIIKIKISRRLSNNIVAGFLINTELKVADSIIERSW